MKDFIINNKKNLALGLFALLILAIWTYYSFHRFPIQNNTSDDYPVHSDGVYAVPSNKAATAVKLVQDNKLEDIVFFTTVQNCPACKEVEDFISSNNLTTKFKISRIDSYANNTVASNEIITKIDDVCDVSIAHSGVPLIFDATDKKCVYSVQAIKDYFNKKL